MDPALERMAEGLRKAMQAEREGQHFYLMAAAVTKDDKARAVLAGLAEEEAEHFRFLQAQLASLLEKESVDPSLDPGEGKALEGPHPIFSESIRARIGNAHFEMTALSVGMQLERAAVEFYTAEAEAVADPRMKSFYRRLARWEQGHFDALHAQAEALQEDYWNRGGFSPF